jgi:serine/threonine-protein kinase
MGLSCPKCGLSYPKQAEHCGLDGERLVEDSRDPLIGRTIDRYRIVEPLGSGGMARVYRAQDVERGQDCALKVLFGHCAADRRLVERLRREAMAVTTIAHPNVVRVYEFGASPAGVCYLAMELLRGESVAKALEASGPFAPLRATAVLRGVAEGLGAAHALGFVHRDLKASNVILVPSSSGNSGDVARIVDFGLVGVVGPAAGDLTQLTRAGEIYGTPASMAPEQISGLPAVVQTDLYALGVLAYEILSGQAPFRGTVAHVLAQHLTREPPPLSAAGGLDALVRRLLEKEARRRPTSAAEVVRELDRIEEALANVPSLALEPVTAPERAGGDTVVDPPRDVERSAPRGLERPAAPVPMASPPMLSPSKGGSQQRRRSRPGWLSAAPWAVTLASVGLAAVFVLRRSVPLPQPPAPAAGQVYAVPGNAGPSALVGALSATVGSGSVDSGVGPGDSGSGGGSGAVSGGGAPGGGSSAKRRPGRPPTPVVAPTAAPPAVPPRDRFRALDQQLSMTLAERSLAFADLEAALPEDAATWSGWAHGAEPDPAKLESTFAVLHRAAAQLAIDSALLERKLDRGLEALKRVPESRRGPAFSDLENRYVELRMALKREPPPKLAERVLSFERAARNLAR